MIKSKSGQWCGVFADASTVTPQTHMVTVTRGVIENNKKQDVDNEFTHASNDHLTGVHLQEHKTRATRLQRTKITSFSVSCAFRRLL